MDNITNIIVSDFAPESRVWFITGASSGFGRAMTELCLAQGDCVVATLRTPSALSSFTEAEGAPYVRSGRLLVLPLDVTSSSAVKTAFAAALKAFGRIDVVFNNAGYGLLAEAETAPEDMARRIMDVNFWGAVYVSRETVRIFRDVNGNNSKGRRVGGTLLQVSSAWAWDGQPGVAYYTASKNALIAFSESLVKELDPAWNIRISIISPGVFKTRVNTTSLEIAPLPDAYAGAQMPSAQLRAIVPASVPDQDPVRAVERIYEVAVGTPASNGGSERQRNNAECDDKQNQNGNSQSGKEMPLHLILGQDALVLVRTKLNKLSEEMERWEGMSHDLVG